MIVVERSAKSVEDAVNQVLKEYNVSREDVAVEVLEAGNKGFLGILGNRQARVRVSIKTPLDHVKAFLDSVVEKMGLRVVYDIKEEGGHVKVNFSGENVGLMIGRRGENLDALQHLCNIVANRYNSTGYIRVLLDAENYRLKREEALKKLAYRMARKAIETGKNVVLEPMTSYERRIIHLALQGMPDIQTYSQGEEPYRKVVIAVK
ncbi:RNA-binding cell elongation regulator Jag/EloR [Caldanaerobius polysaccharolyticus]|uniref:RNA-binding cell elongation regulator Jag/EloR n=1 Tax=Caldanaerobius polysaccharolyticus TaxID=44256 RepID=UPI00047A8024|nr:RNA-binding cell elongation regulator Jag/EloR [Caldanaerobius polysaccharolyticus]